MIYYVCPLKNFSQETNSQILDSFTSFTKAIIVTSDSVSMVTEACSSGKPVYIIDIPTKSKKFSLFIKNLINLHLAHYLRNSISLKKNDNVLNDIDMVVSKIKKKLIIK